MTQYSDIFIAFGIQILLQNDLILSQRAGLVGAQDVHLTKSLNGTQMFDDGLLPAHGDGAFGQRRSHHDR